MAAEWNEDGMGNRRQRYNKWLTVGDREGNFSDFYANFCIFMRKLKKKLQMSEKISNFAD